MNAKEAKKLRKYIREQGLDPLQGPGKLAYKEAKKYARKHFHG